MCILNWHCNFEATRNRIRTVFDILWHIFDGQRSSPDRCGRMGTDRPGPTIRDPMEPGEECVRGGDSDRDAARVSPVVIQGLQDEHRLGEQQP